MSDADMGRSRIDIDYTYASSKHVAECGQLKGLNQNAFGLALEAEVYRDDVAELEVPVDQRVRLSDRVTFFIQRCLFKYYDVPEHLQGSAWKRVKKR
ncbi:hypothetical protein COOONC_26492 [Cooperia oncophora]